MISKEEFLRNLTWTEVIDIINEGLFWNFDIPEDVTYSDICQWIKENG